MKMNFLPAERLRLYRNFKAIEVNDYHGLVRYYEQNEDGIRGLDFVEYLDCTLVYTNALFEASNYGKHLVMCDHLLEVVIMQNVVDWDGQDLYHLLLLKKATSLYYLQEYGKSARMLYEIIKIYPNDRLAAVFLNQALLRQKPGWLFSLRAATVVFALMAVLVIALEILAGPKYFPTLLQPMQFGHNLLIALSLASIAIGEAWHALSCRIKTTRFVKVSSKKLKGGETG
jgi:hypothetical protein